MKNKLFMTLIAMLLCLSLAIPAFAEEIAGAAHVVDGAGLLTESEKADLDSALAAAGSKHSLLFAVVTAESLGEQTPMQYADAQFQALYGDADGAMLLVAMETGDWYLSTCGKGITVFTDAGIAYIGEKIVPFLSDGEYKKAFDTFTELCDAFAVQAESGEPYDSGNLPHEPLSTVWIVIAPVVGFLLALLVVGNMKSKLKTVRAQDEAANYIRKDSLIITGSRDLYLYRTVTRTKKAENQDSSSGSSTHESSSGTTHGGGGGKF